MGPEPADTSIEMPSRGSRSLILAWAVLALVGCGGAEPDPQAVTRPAPTTPASGTVVGTTTAAVGTFRACHKHRDGSLVLILLFENRDRSLIDGFEGALGYRVEALDPSTWSRSGDPVSVDPGYNDHVRQITVPADETAPSEVTLSVTTTAAVDETNVLAANEVTIPVPATACSSA